MEFLYAFAWIGLIGLIATLPKEIMQAIWLIAIGLILASPLLALVLPAFR